MEVIRLQKPRSAWGKGVKWYAAYIINHADVKMNATVPADMRKTLLCGAKDWKQYAYGGFGQVWNQKIAKRLCSPSEYKKVNEGMRNPNSRENWLDVEARALYQAYRMIEDARRVLKN